MALCKKPISKSFRQTGFGPIGRTCLHRTRQGVLWTEFKHVSNSRVSEGLGTTCNREVAVSVRTPPKAPRWTGRAVLEDKREEAGRERRETERVNTMMSEEVSE